MIYIMTFCIASLVYVYALRGKARFVSMTEYFRKGWPFLAPLNCLLYLFTRPKALRPIMRQADFAELQLIQDNWQVVREEAMALYSSNVFDQVGADGADAYYDVGFRTFHKYGWRKFYLTWYGCTQPSAQRLCPRTVEVIKQVKAVNGAMFTVLPPGAQLTRHLDPIACSLRYHLGLSTPNNDDCFINIDGQTYSWRDGQVLLFDETYLHYAKNDTDTPRVILMCDVERPMHTLGYIFLLLYKRLSALSVVPNLPGDKKGLFNRIFSTLAPAIARGKNLKKRNRSLYLCGKYLLNATLLALVFGFFYLLTQLL